MHVFDVLDEAEYNAALENGHIYQRRHQELPYILHSQSKTLAWEGVWNETTLTCRGLVTHADTGEIIARPFKKFFNSNQPEAPLFNPDDKVVVMDKVDGSLGILVPTESGHIITTKGGWESEQAQTATQIFQEKYSDVKFPRGITMLFEIVAPEHRIVLDYGDTRDLILIGAIENETGKSLHPYNKELISWHGPRVEIMQHKTFREALSAPPRPNAEGFVIWKRDTDDRVKVKQDDYLRLHKVVTGLNARTVWEALRDNRDLAEEFSSMPDEFYQWVLDCSEALELSYRTKYIEYQREFNRLNDILAGGGVYQNDEGYMKQFATLVQSQGLSNILFLFARKDKVDRIESAIWNEVKPSADWKW